MCVCVHICTHVCVAEVKRNSSLTANMIRHLPLPFLFTCTPSRQRAFPSKPYPATALKPWKETLLEKVLKIMSTSLSWGELEEPRSTNAERRRERFRKETTGEQRERCKMSHKTLWDIADSTLEQTFALLGIYNNYRYNVIFLQNIYCMLLLRWDTVKVTYMYGHN